MKAIHYDREGDILSVTFTEAKEQKHIGLELSDNIVFYYNPETKTPLKSHKSDILINPDR